ncbi:MULTISPECIES: Gfo/Idh/MocA family protein [Natrialbaceae]|uniref:Gfo/Idh/MocA family protein n=1 Tax=Natrialbaceae TaxID=1644061 RepID=UPI00207D69D7|nr:Gfo/Idh/MocA family oxidoreductase [Natronococcus sp. CG52]
MIELGLLGLDTSHPETFASILDRADVSIAAVWDGGDVRERGYTREFCERYDASRYDDPHAMVDDVDAAMVLAVDWNAHRRLATPFLEAGVPTMIDKPLAGSVADVRAIERAAMRGGAPLFGGSSLPFHPSVSSLADTTTETAFSVGYGDSFYYGVHLVDSVRLLAGADWTRVAPNDGPGRVATIDFADGSAATLRFDGPDSDGTFGFLTVGERTQTVQVGSSTDELDRMYEPFLEEFLAAARGERDDRNRVVDSGILLIGVQTAFNTGESVTPDDSALTTTEISSDSFVAGYEPYY